MGLSEGLGLNEFIRYEGIGSRLSNCVLEKQIFMKTLLTYCDLFWSYVTQVFRVLLSGFPSADYLRVIKSSASIIRTYAITILNMVNNIGLHYWIKILTSQTGRCTCACVFGYLRAREVIVRRLRSDTLVAEHKMDHGELVHVHEL